MTSITSFHPANWKLVDTLVKGIALFNQRERQPAGSEENAKMSRDLVLDIMHGHPEAFQSEADFHNLLQIYPGRY